MRVDSFCSIDSCAPLCSLSPPLEGRHHQRRHVPCWRHQRQATSAYLSPRQSCHQNRLDALVLTNPSFVWSCHWRSHRQPPLFPCSSWLSWSRFSHLGVSPSNPPPLKYSLLLVLRHARNALAKASRELLVVGSAGDGSAPPTPPQAGELVDLGADGSNSLGAHVCPYGGVRVDLGSEGSKPIVGYADCPHHNMLVVGHGAKLQQIVWP